MLLYFIRLYCHHYIRLYYSYILIFACFYYELVSMYFSEASKINSKPFTFPHLILYTFHFYLKPPQPLIPLHNIVFSNIYTNSFIIPSNPFLIISFLSIKIGSTIYDQDLHFHIF